MRKLGWENKEERESKQNRTDVGEKRTLSLRKRWQPVSREVIGQDFSQPGPKTQGDVVGQSLFINNPAASSLPAVHCARNAQ